MDLDFIFVDYPLYLNFHARFLDHCLGKLVYVCQYPGL